MRRTRRALASLALGLALATATTAAAAAMPPTETQDPHDRLAQHKALYQSELERNLQLRNQRDQQSRAEQGLLAQRKVLYQSELQRNLATARTARVIAAQPAARTAPAAPSPGLDVLATLLVGLPGGLLGGAAATRRRSHRPASAPEPVPKA
jgi:hypothetical protein